MSAQCLVFSYINLFQKNIYSIVTVVPIVIYTLILRYFDSTDKFDSTISSESVEHNPPLVFFSNDNTINKIKCDKYKCDYYSTILLTNSIISDCYHWIFKISQNEFAGICIHGSITHPFDKTGTTHGFSVNNILRKPNNDVIEMVLNFEDKLLFFFENNDTYVGGRLLLKYVKLYDYHTKFIAGIYYSPCTKGKYSFGMIKLLNSGYIDAPTQYEQHKHVQYEQGVKGRVPRIYKIF